MEVMTNIYSAIFTREIIALFLYCKGGYISTTNPC